MSINDFATPTVRHSLIAVGVQVVVAMAMICAGCPASWAFVAGCIAATWGYYMREMAQGEFARGHKGIDMMLPWVLTMYDPRWYRDVGYPALTTAAIAALAVLA